MSTLKKEQKTTVKAPNGAIYTTTRLLGENENFRFYELVSEIHPDQAMILKIVTDKAKNHVLDREAYLLTEMSKEAVAIDDEYKKTHDDTTLNYQLGFPYLIDNFTAEEQEGRRILILNMTMANALSDIVPIVKIREIDKVKVDPKTSVWILGKLLKIIAFAHDRAFATVGKIDAENIFIVKENHLVALFDWSQSVIHGSSISKKMAMSELRQAVQAVVSLLGGDLETGNIPDHEQLEENGERYRELLKVLLKGDFETVYDAHRYFYEGVEEIWQRKYHPYSTIPQ